ncbi:flagellar hook-associated protein FlgL [Thiopseudomonas denitrificans]|uniref:Flagellar hook-associated protein 3 FlgL n=1 Tax=Thiopseudomonas denitrificans TaxID=1501432 RepID=A0A4V3D5A9_9GAMM|nr:flagellar hook-associated protein FlgL [Thiopseudomonas denitrificans]TDQ39397.1 flagellar hook-associated protein 3 FlgL [Thiopseudomonas denitrificans]
MRISSQQAFNLGVKGIQNNYAELIRTNQQITTGNRILTPADDPVASVRLMQLEQQQNMLGQYKDNLVAANNSLVQEESVLNSVNDIMQRIRVLAEEAGNGALSQSDRQSIAAELREREDELLGLMNTKNARGEYLFSGFQGKTQPFVRQGDGSFVYMGDEGQRKLQVASSLDIPISDNGKKVFQNVTNAARLDANYTQPTGSSLTVSSPLVQDEIAYTSAPGYPDSQFEIRFNDPANPKNYEIVETTTGTSLQTGSLDDDDKLHDSLVFAGVVVHLDGVPNGTETISITADPAREKQGVLDTIYQLRKALEENPDSPEGNRDTRDAVAAAITNIDHAMVTIDQTRGDIGARMNIIETTQTNNEDVTLVNKAVQAELREVDYAEALSKLAFQSVILEAAQQSYVKVSGLNLFNKI